MTTERELRDAKRLVEREYSGVEQLRKGKRLKSLDEMQKRAPTKRLRRNKRRPARIGRKHNPLQYLLILAIVVGTALMVSVEVSCRVNGDPMPHQDWRVGYDYTPMIDATDIENCRINTRILWKERATEWFRDLL